MAAPKISAAIRADIAERNLVVWHCAYRSGPNGRCGAQHGVFLQLNGPGLELLIPGSGKDADEAAIQALSDPKATMRAPGLIGALAGLENEMAHCCRSFKWHNYRNLTDEDIPF